MDLFQPAWMEETLYTFFHILLVIVPVSKNLKNYEFKQQSLMNTNRKILKFKHLARANHIKKCMQKIFTSLKKKTNQKMFDFE